MDSQFKNSELVVVQLLSCVWFFATPWTVARQTPLSSTISWNLFKFMSIESVMLPNRCIFCCSLLLPSVVPASVFSSLWVVYIKWPKYWSFSISLCSEYSGLISFKIGLISLLSERLNSLFQSHSTKASFWHSAFFMTQLSHLYLTTRKTIASTKQTFFGKVMSLLFNMLSRFVIAFLPRSQVS